MSLSGTKVVQIFLQSPYERLGFLKLSMSLLPQKSLCVQVSCVQPCRCVALWEPGLKKQITDLATDTAVGNKLPFVPDPGLVSSISIYGMVAG